jgi:PAS domain S-box-containing protein
MNLRLDTQRSYAFASVAVLLGVTSLALPMLGRALPVLPFVFPLCLFLVALLALATATLLLVRARIEASFPLAILAAAYAFALPLLIGTAVSLPENVIWRGSIGAELEAATDCFTTARLGFAAGLLLFALTGLPAARRRIPAFPFWFPAACALGFALLCVVVIFGANDRLPDLVGRDDFSFVHTMLCAVSTLFGLAAVALLALRRNATPIECWAGVAAAAAVLETVFAALVSAKYSLGWYAMRGFCAFAYAAVLAALLMQASRVARALNERLSAEETLRTLSETIPQIVWTAQPTGAVDWANKRWFDYTGQGDDELAYRWQAVVHPADLAQFKRRLPQALGDAGDFEVDLRLRGQDGVYRWFLTRVVPVRDASGRVVRWYGTSTNVDEQRQQAVHLRELFAREHRIAASLQAAFLPANFPRSAGLAFSHVYRPAASDENVGGDWYDSFRVGERRIAVCVGDVSGHGIDAAVRMLRVRELLRAAAFDDAAPSVVLARAARSLGAGDPEHTVTALYGVFDTGLGRLTYASAGHPPPTFLRDGTARSLAYGGLPLGVELRSRYEDHTLLLHDGDVVTLFTDGLIEAARDAIEGERRLREVLESGITGAAALASELVPERQLDDVAVVTIAIGPVEAGLRAPRPWRFHAADAARAAGARASFALYFDACGASDDEVLCAEHALGELLGNVVRHAPGPVDIELAWRDRTPVLSVSDRGSQPFAGANRLGPALYAECGRGLLMLREFGLRPIAFAREGGGTRMVVTLSCAALEHTSVSVA